MPFTNCFRNQATYQHFVSGESGAAGLGGFIVLMTKQSLQEVKERLQINEKSSILFINSEGATDPENFNQIIDKN